MQFIVLQLDSVSLTPRFPVAWFSLLCDAETWKAAQPLPEYYRVVNVVEMVKEFDELQKQFAEMDWRE